MRRGVSNDSFLLETIHSSSAQIANPTNRNGMAAGRANALPIRGVRDHHRCGYRTRGRIQGGSSRYWQRWAKGVPSRPLTARRCCRACCCRFGRAEQRASVGPARRAGRIRPIRKRRVDTASQRRWPEEVNKRVASFLGCEVGADNGRFPVRLQDSYISPRRARGSCGEPQRSPGAGSRVSGHALCRPIASCGWHWDSSTAPRSLTGCPVRVGRMVRIPRK